jgi:hypothetical protein
METDLGLTIDAPKATNNRRRNRFNGGITMKPIGIISATALLLLVGVAAPMDARQEKPEKQEEKTKPAKQEQQAKPQHQQQAKPEKQQQGQGQQQQRQQQQAQAPKQQQQRQQQAKGQQNQQRQQAQQQDRSSQRPQRTQQEEARQREQPELRLSDRGNSRISDERFHSNFGREHHFRIGSPVLVGGYSRFQYGGYWFGFVEPWPVGWYYTDDVYIDYVDGGYYMYDPYYPGARFAISVVL